MKTHEFASFLRDLADALGRLPDTEMTSLPVLLQNLSLPKEQADPIPAPATPRSKRESPIAEGIYKTLSTLKKHEIASIVQESGLPVQIRPKDSANNALSKVRRYLLENPHAVRTLRSTLSKHQPHLISQPLSRALETLLGNRDEISITGR